MNKIVDGIYNGAYPNRCGKWFPDGLLYLVG